MRREHARKHRHGPWDTVLLFMLAMGPVLAVPGERGADLSSWEQRAVPADAAYRSPVQLLLNRSGRRLYVACENSGQVLVIATRQRGVVDSIRVGRGPFGMALSPDEQTLYVSNRDDNDVLCVDLREMRSTGSMRVGDDPHQLAIDPAGRHLFVPNLGTNTISVVDLEQRQQVRLLQTGRAPFGLAMGPAGTRLFVSNQYSNAVPFRTAPVLELTVVDVAQLFVQERRALYSTVIGQGIAVSPDGAFVATAVEFPKNLIPETQVYQGWMVTYGFALTETCRGGRTAYLLIDEPNRYFADPYGIAFTPDGKYLLLSSSGADQVTIVDMAQVYRVLEVTDGRIGISTEQIARYARHLGLSSEYVVARVPTAANPKGLVIGPRGKRAYVACRLADEISVIDIPAGRALAPIRLGGPETLTLLRWGAQLFNYASISFQRQMSCATCHPENSVDGLVYDIAVDGGMGRNLVDNLTLRGIAHTAPFKWTGKNPDLARQEGPRAAQLFFRTHGFSEPEKRAVVAFIESMPTRPNRYRGEGGKLTEEQKWGQMMFERSYDKMGCYIPVANRCVTCHPRPYGTDRRTHNVSSAASHDRDGNFDTPHLLNVFERAPYMHDGRCYSLEEIWTEFNPDDTHGVSNDMMKEQLNALIEYTKTY